MTYVDDRAARLYYDGGCGSCTVLARAAAVASRHRLVAIPLDTPAAARELADLSEEARFGSAHLVTASARSAGADIAAPLLGFFLGERAARAIDRIPSLKRGLAWAYGRLWNFRRTHGCASATFS